MRIVGIDPSFTSTGIAVTDDLEYVASLAIHSGGSIYEGADHLHRACMHITEQVEKFVTKYDPDYVIMEYPAQSKSGFYLMTLQGWILSRLLTTNAEIYIVPPTACDSFIKNKEHRKSFIVNYCKDNDWVPKIRINNDICTAVVLTHLLDAFNHGLYKNKVFKVDPFDV